MQRILTLASGFALDYSNMLGAARLQETDFSECQPQLLQAHQAVQQLVATGISSYGQQVLFTQLPEVKFGNINTPSSLAKIEAYAQALQNRVQAVVSLGVGGSYLGGRVLFESMVDEYWNSLSARERGGRPKLYFAGNSLSAESGQSLLRELLRQGQTYMREQGKRYTVTLLVTSKSGTTLECITNFMSLYTNLADFADLLNLEVVVITETSQLQPNPLEALAKIWGWEVFRVPAGIGGRFCVFADPGLLIGAILGLDIQSFLRGAQDMSLACQTDNVWENPALLNATLKYLAAQKNGKCIEVFMPYAPQLKALGEWYVQLLAESLGKKDKAGVAYGRTPVAAIGSTDMHAQTQEHQEGLANKIVQFLEISHEKVELRVPQAFEQQEFFARYAGLSLNKLNKQALEANAQALASVNRPNMKITLPVLDMYYLGNLMYFYMLSITYEAQLAQVNAFDQPGVEVYKQYLRTHGG